MKLSSAHQLYLRRFLGGAAFALGITAVFLFLFLDPRAFLAVGLIAVVSLAGYYAFLPGRDIMSRLLVTPPHSASFALAPGQPFVVYNNAGVAYIWVTPRASDRAGTQVESGRWALLTDAIASSPGNTGESGVLPSNISSS